MTLQEFYEELKEKQGHPAFLRSMFAPTMRAFATASTPEDERTFRLLVSTDTPDRNNNVVLSRGGDFSEYRANPVLLWGHLLNDPNAVLGRTLSIDTKETSIEAMARYEPLTHNPLPAQILELETRGLIPGNSIGLRPVEVEKAGDLRIISKWKLIDISKVVVPMDGMSSNLLL